MSLLERQSPGVGMTPDHIRARKLPLALNLAVAVAALALAAGTPLGYGVLKDHQPVGPLSSKVALVAPDDE